MRVPAAPSAFLALPLLLPASCGRDAPDLRPAERAVRVLICDQGPVDGSGVGFFVAQGVLCTCRHVVSGSVRAWVVDPDGRRREVRGVLAEDRDLDLALLAVDPDPERDGVLPLDAADEAVRSRRCLALRPRRGDQEIDPEAEAGEEAAFGFEVLEGRILEHRAAPGGATLLGATCPLLPGDSGTPLLDADGRRVLGVFGFHRPLLAEVAEDAAVVRAFALSATEVARLMHRAAATDARPLDVWLAEWLESAEGRFASAQNARVAGREGLARRLLDLAARDAPSEVEVRLAPLEDDYRALTADGAPDPERAAAFLAAVADVRALAPRRVFDPLGQNQTWFWEGDVRLRLGDAARAARALEVYVEREPHDPDGLVLLARAARRAGEDRLARRAEERLRGLLRRR